MRKTTAYAAGLAAGLLLLATGLIDGCGPGSEKHKTYKKNTAYGDTPDENIAKGEVLAAKYCRSCHLLPDPDLLNANSWKNGVLPAMGPRLGIFSYQYQTYPSSADDPDVGRAFYPASPLLSEQEWGYIIDYYSSVSPDSLPAQQRQYRIGDGLPLFRVRTPSWRYPKPATVLARMDTSRGVWYTSDALTGRTYMGDRNMKVTDSIRLRGPVTDLLWQKDSLLACDIGILTPTNAEAGLVEVLQTAGGKFKEGDSVRTLAGPLRRPVQMAAGDLNGDGLQDLVVCEFGYIKGALTWWENKGSGRYERHLLRDLPGAIRVYIQDYNHDGLPDIWAQFAQGDEGIFLYTNRGHGVFEEQTVLRFPPSYGSTYFELDDFNQDGYPDILYTCGDNGDYSTVLKPYHGIYIFLNDGHNHFTKRWFFPMNGCYKAVARDFDGDGDLDIAAIAYFADFKRQPEEGFVYLRNEGGWDFHPYTLPEGKLGRWITMDVGDFDGDGRPDLLLGNCSVGPGFLQSATDWKAGPPFLFLRNTGAAQNAAAAAALKTLKNQKTPPASGK